jgi:glycosyltransferase involved in cell wall biosynthesis
MGRNGPLSRLTSIVIPAHNEEHSIGQLLGALLHDAAPGEFEIVVVCNGCTDDTARVAREAGSDVRVVEITQPGKAEALKQGDAHVSTFPRVYLDADVELDTAAVRLLVAPLAAGGVEATAPARVIELEHASRLVRGYYDVWTRLPQVRSGLFGRGVVAVSKEGFERTRNLPMVMSDDLAMSEVFDERARRIVSEARVVIQPPRTMRDLMRRRIRVNTGTAQLDRLGARSIAVKTSRRDLTAIAREHPSTALHMPIFLGIAAASRLAARRRIRRGDFTTWLRDDSSRLPTPGA